ncbi:MAG: hypothetical protein OEZ68_05290 [Gammaproteobacteria bacterium]|nr:hypothetical protein [Gammaproteobacteria bacterium]MDH5800204.1 hypothetical protein [Gammaproteobacteria bacterium]
MLRNIKKLLLNLFLHITEEVTDRITWKREPVFHKSDAETEDSITIDFD